MADKIITEEYVQKAEEFYKQILAVLHKNKIPVLIGGTYAVKHYADIDRLTKDLDIFCKAGDYPVILKTLQDAGFTVAVEDERWLAKIFSEDKYFVDLIFGSIPGTWPITEEWFSKAHKSEILGYDVLITPPEELILSKAYRFRRDRFDGSDIYNLILKVGDDLDWHRLLDKIEPNWELLLVHLLMYRFTYPSEREKVPKWLIAELVKRLSAQLEIPTPRDKSIRGSLYDPVEFRAAVERWGFKDITQDYTPRPEEIAHLKV